MCHLIEFRAAFTADIEISPRHRLERLKIQKGQRAHVTLRPYILETPQCPVEVADIAFDDGTVARAVPFAWFQFVDE